jgi:hypothetical protein
LKNGESLPDKKYFENESYNAETRTFKGKIVWSPLTFHGASTWEFTLHFDEDFTKITAEKSEKVGKNAYGKTIQVYVYEVDLIYRKKK